MTAPAPSPAEQAAIDRFGIFDEERVVEEVARAMYDSDHGWENDDAWIDGAAAAYRRLAAAAVAAMRENEEKGARK